MTDQCRLASHLSNKSHLTLPEYQGLHEREGLTMRNPSHSLVPSLVPKTCSRSSLIPPFLTEGQRPREVREPPDEHSGFGPLTQSQGDVAADGHQEINKTCSKGSGHFVYDGSIDGRHKSSYTHYKVHCLVTNSVSTALWD